MTDTEEIEEALQKLWDEFSVQPQYIEPSPEVMEHLARHRPGGGSSHQRRVWYRMWSPTRFSKRREQ